MGDNQYFREFVSNSFSKFDNNVVHHIPVVDFDFPDKKILTDIHDIVKDLLEYFTPLPGGQIYNDWFKEPTHDGHAHLNILDSGNQATFLYHSSETVERQKEILFSTMPEYASSGLKDAIDTLNEIMPMVDLCDIHVCAANGWLHPHKDIKEERTKLRIWVPLHDFPTCLKVFPFGWVNHQLGKGYVFDNNNYVHAVHNTTDYNRFVLIAGIDNVNPPKWIKDQLDKNKSHWRDIFTQEYCE